MSSVVNPESPLHLVASGEADREAICAQLARIQSSPPFHHSKRYPRLLQFVVDETLAGRAEQLKERLLGIEVFGRPADYDLANDPIVRVVAGEIRKRLAQYYIDHECELRIRLAPGSYVPEFYWPGEDKLIIPDRASPPALPLVEAASGEPHSDSAFAAWKPTHRTWLMGIAACLVLCVLVAGIYFHSRSSLVERFWQPMLGAEVEPIICLGDVGMFMKSDPEHQSFEVQHILSLQQMTALTDVKALTQVTSLLDRHERHPVLYSSNAVAYEELQQHPAILIGWRDNPWSLRAVETMRYRFHKDDQKQLGEILDAADGGRVKWSVDLGGSALEISKAYAIVARYLDRTTGQPTILIAGLGLNGTENAAQFVTTRDSLKAFADRAPRGWEDRNVEIVLGSQVINGTTGPLHIVALSTW